MSMNLSGWVKVRAKVKVKAKVSVRARVMVGREGERGGQGFQITCVYSYRSTSTYHSIFVHLVGCRTGQRVNLREHAIRT